MAEKSSIFWEAIAVVMVMVALTPLALPSMSSVFEPPHKGTEIIVRMYIQESGGFDPDVITVKKGVPVKLVLMTMDVPHGFAIQGLGIDTGVILDKKIIEFTPLKEGVYIFICTINCSPLHHFMRGTLVVED